MRKDAVIDSSGQYRYVLERFWGPDETRIANFVLLNPSTADATEDDPTSRKCISFAKTWGLDGVIMTNLFALRETSPAKMKKHPNPVGPMNDEYLLKTALSAEKVVVAWGNHGQYLSRNIEVLELFRKKAVEIYCLDQNLSGCPKHPLYIRSGTKLKKIHIKASI